MHLQLLADLLVVIHLGFILFVLFGALLVWRWRPVAWLHVPACLQGACPRQQPLVAGAVPA